MANQSVEVELVSVDQAGTMTGMSPWSWRRYAYAGVVPSVKLGTRLLIPRQAILDHIAAHTRPKLQKLSGVETERPKVGGIGEALVEHSRPAEKDTTAPEFREAGSDSPLSRRPRSLGLGLSRRGAD